MNLYDILKQALATSRCTDMGCVFPTILVDCLSKTHERGSGITMADIAIDYLEQFGFKSDRTRMNLNGYPGLFRKLKVPPPWAEVTQDDVDDTISQARLKELRPLYLQADENDSSDLVSRFNEHIEKQQGAPLSKIGINYPSGTEQFKSGLFEEQLSFARNLGTKTFEQLYEAIFDSDEFIIQAGAPDLFVWNQEFGIWFFAEVKGPKDHLRNSQATWVRANWERIKGRFVLFVIPPKAF